MEKTSQSLVRAGEESSVAVEVLDNEGCVHIKGKPGQRTENETEGGSAEWRKVVWEEGFGNEWKPGIHTLRIRFSQTQVYGIEGDLELIGIRYE